MTRSMILKALAIAVCLVAFAVQARQTKPPKGEENSYHHVKSHTTKKGVHVREHYQRNPGTRPTPKKKH